MSGTLPIARLIVRRDRVRIVVWTLTTVFIAAASAIGVRDLYEDPAELQQYAQTVGDNVTVVAFNGPAYDIGTVGGRVAFETSTQLAVAIALMALLSMTRHTRAEEESGRAELLRAAPTGRHAALAAALGVTCAESVLIGALVAAAMVASDFAMAGSVALGAIVAGSGIAFAAIGAVAVQVTEHGRAASGISLAALGVTFTVRAVGDTAVPWLRWLSPIGVAQLVHAFSGERWAPLLVLLAGSAVLVAVAVALSARRDLGAGLVATRPGPSRASASLGTAFGLALRLQRGLVVAWSIGLFVFGAVMGSIAQGAEELIGDDERMREIMAAAGVADVVASFLATMTLLLALTACGFALQSAMRAQTEEAAGRGELVLSTGVSRRAWLGANGAVTVAGTLVVLVATGTGIGLAHGIRVGDVGQVPRMIGASLSLAPGVLLLAAVAVLLFGVAPRLLALAWVPLSVAAVVGVFGDVLDVPSWVASLSPFDHLAMVPAESLAVVPLLVVAALAVACAAVGAAGYARRDAA